VAKNAPELPALPSCFITTPIYYVNDRPHIGHAYTTIACDVLARFKRLDGYDVKFLTGTDEHGQKIARVAQDKGVTPQALADQNSQNFRDLAKTLNASNDDFIRTTEDRHKRACQALWKRLEERGHIYLSKYSGWYAVRDEAFYDEGELTTTAEGAKLAPTGAPVEWVEEESYFFDLSKWQNKLLALYDGNPDFIGPKSRFNEVRSFVAGGLHDLSISRTTFSWGVPVPGNPKHVMYVWIDALTNYISALGYPEATPEMATLWPTAIHTIGKDIIRFHAVYWPAFLMAADLPLPKRVYAHGWWTVEGQKMSKSLGNVVDPHEMVAKYGLDQFRYFLMREVPFGNDGDFSEAAMAQRINGELANELGNLAQRFLSFIGKNLGGVLPAPGALTTEDEVLLAHAAGMLEDCRKAFERQAYHEALEIIWKVVRDANAYVDKQAPWALRKTDPARMNTVLYVLAEAVRYIAILMQPFTPEAMAKLLDQLAVAPNARAFANLTSAHALKGDTALPPPQGVFPRYGDPKTGRKG
jgi:methionyl-tRNA synthetase